MPILFDEKRRRWTLQGGNVTYGTKLDDHSTAGENEPVSGEAPVWQNIKARMNEELSSTLVEVTEQ